MQEIVEGNRHLKERKFQCVGSMQVVTEVNEMLVALVYGIFSYAKIA
jgi:hypothetical protein